MKLKPVYFLFIAAVMIVTSATPQTKHALIFAIGKYKSSSWHSLNSSTDAAVMKTTLLSQGFKDANIRIIQNEKATHKGIADTLNAFLNDKNVNPGDIVVIHFSAHGEQLEDDNGDEIIDGLDESIVSYDAVYDPDKKKYKNVQANYFRDDEFGAFIDRLRIKLGKSGDILVFIDACHSGTGTKGTAVARGGMPALVSETFNPIKWKKEDTNQVFMEPNPIKADKNDLATYVVFSAGSSNEIDLETDDSDYGAMGSLTNAVIKVFGQLETNITYNSLFKQIQNIMNKTVPGQHPVIEGDGKDRKLFGGDIISQKPYIDINSIDGKQITLNAGTLSGLDAGAKIVIVPSETPDPSAVKPLASGTVINATAYTATVVLDEELHIQPVQGWAFLIEPVFKTEPIVLRINPGFSETEMNSIRKSLKDLPLFRTTGEPELILTKSPKTDSILIFSNGYLFDTINTISSERIKEKFQHYAQYKFLRDFEMVDPATNVEVSLVPVINKNPDTTKINMKSVLGTYTYKDGDTLVLWVKNHGNFPVYFNVVDLQPNGVINAILPKHGIVEAGDLIIGGKVSKIIKGYFIKIRPPCGNEIFKVIVSKELINMEMITNSPGAKGSFKPLESLVNNSYNLATKDAQHVNISNAEGTVYNLLFRIVACKK